MTPVDWFFIDMAALGFAGYMSVRIWEIWKKAKR